MGDLTRRLRTLPCHGGEAAHEEQVDEQVEVGGDRLAVHGEGAGERGGVEQAALLVREHRPEPAQGLRRDARPELRDVALEVGADELRAPAQARRVGSGQQALRKAAAQPERVEPLAADLAGVERARAPGSGCVRRATRSTARSRSIDAEPSTRKRPVAAPAPPCPRR